MERFAAGHTRVLVSTTVVEVGLDVPGATVVIVLDAERFGLAQLHQLRGRVGRGDRPGRCLLLHRDPDASERLAVLVRHDDGLAIADADLRERGPGELLGTAQHGAAALKIADLPDDLDLLQNAHATAAIRIRAGETCPALLNRLLITGAADVLAGG
jgi:ATP-dependent DNA helicase RecG